MRLADYDRDFRPPFEEELKSLLNLIGLPSGWFGRINMDKQMFVIFRVKGTEHYMTYVGAKASSLAIVWVHAPLGL
jgi:hypothetical protein